MKKLTFILFCGLLCTVNLNAQTWQIGYPNATDVTATLQDSTLTISGTGAMLDWNHFASPHTPWFFDDNIRTSIEAIIIENGVTTIGNFAFSFCTALTSVSIPNSVVTIGNRAFNTTALTSINIPNSVRTIGWQAFGFCTALTSIIIPNSVTTIGFGVFEGCTALTSIEVDANNPNFSSINGVLFNRDQSVLHIYPEGKQVEYYTIPSSVRTIYDYAFFDTSLTSVTISNSVTTIGYMAFGVNMNSETRHLRNVIIEDCTTPLHLSGAGWSPDTLYLGRNINSWAGSFGNAIKHLTIGNNVTAIGFNAFWNNRELTSVTIGSSVVIIGNMAFSGCNALRSIISLSPIPPAVVASTFNNVSRELCTVYAVSDEALALYQNAEVWRDFLNIKVYEPSNIETVNAETIQIFPNPVVGELRIINHEWQVGDVVELYDMSGRIVETWRAASLQHGEFTIDMSPFKAGNYILRIGNRVAKVVKL